MIWFALATIFSHQKTILLAAEMTRAAWVLTVSVASTAPAASYMCAITAVAARATP